MGDPEIILWPLQDMTCMEQIITGYNNEPCLSERCEKAVIKFKFLCKVALLSALFWFAFYFQVLVLLLMGLKMDLFFI